MSVILSPSASLRINSAKNPEGDRWDPSLGTPSSPRCLRLGWDTTAPTCSSLPSPPCPRASRAIAPCAGRQCAGKLQKAPVAPAPLFGAPYWCPQGRQIPVSSPADADGSTDAPPQPD